MQYPVVPVAGEAVPLPWLGDERDGFISWIRSEFAAANALIDVLMQHLMAIGEPGEYDHVAGCIHQRRCQWSSVLHLQQFFPINEVTFALQQIVLRKQEGLSHRRHRRHQHSYRNFDGNKAGFGNRQGGDRFETARESDFSVKKLVLGVGGSAENGVEVEGSEEKEETGPSVEEACAGVAAETLKVSCSLVDGSSVGCDKANNVEVADSNHPKEAKGTSMSSVPENGDANIDHNGKQDIIPMSKSDFPKEKYDGKLVTIADGLKLYEDLLDSSEVTELVTLANEMRAAGHRGELPGVTAVTLRRPMKGHGREMIQLGIPIALEDGVYHTNCERKVDALPTTLLNVFNKLVKLQVLLIKPDYCVIDFFDEGEHSNPLMWPSWYGRPVCNLFLTECDVVYGCAREIVYDHLGDHSGPVKLTLTPGALLVIEGKNLDRRALPSVRKQRIVLTFGKYRPKNVVPSGILGADTCAGSPMTSWVPVSNQPVNFLPHPSDTKHAITPATGASPSIQPQNVPNTMQPLFFAPPSVAPTALSYPLTTTAAPGTGVFLPPGSSNSAPQQSEVDPVFTKTNSLPFSGTNTGNGGHELEKPNDGPKDGTEMIGGISCNGN